MALAVWRLGNANWHSEVTSCDWAVPDLVAALPLPDKLATGSTEQFPQWTIELWRHSADSWFSFAQGGNLQKQITWINTRMIVWQ
jgi:hypothetical protein